MGLTTFQLCEHHQRSSYNFYTVMRTSWASCYFCLDKFRTVEIVDLVDDGLTVLCPRCGVDAVLPYHMGSEALRDMHEHWFGACRTSKGER